jgi:hypothetical protein
MLSSAGVNGPVRILGGGGKALNLAAICAVSLIVGGCGGGSSASSSSATASAGARQNVRLQSQLLTLGTSGGDAPGAQLVSTSMLFSSQHAGAIGRGMTACTRTARGGGLVFQCSVSFLLPGGNIYGEAVSSTQGPGSGIVSGGSGIYADARGTFSYQRTRGPRVDLVFRLVG